MFVACGWALSVIGFGKRKSTQKSDRFVVKASIYKREGIEEELEDNLFLYNDPTELQTGNVLVNQITNNAVACCFAYLYNQSLNGWNRRFGLFQPFYFYLKWRKIVF